MAVIEIDDAQYEYIRQATIANHLRRFNDTNGYAIAVNFWHFRYNGSSKDFARKPYSRVLWGYKGQIDYQPIFVPYLSDTPSYYFGEGGGIAVSFETELGENDYVYIHGSYECAVSYDSIEQKLLHGF
ncbi:MAG: hypothetical protein F6K48_17640 [Okeania sp. SIO3H1]|uniref:hypothetical protein n=1 Tax=Okeania sp. SIO1I7 TaxID=2607772 RepID=UPI0013CBB935|nr:hypothetical protein [Okeania sp. SIO1I7]NEN90632.1 hypothetical protein [Okeania sp. SIO3H1]NET24984.1 hypothetical protein [Okeania sp. SIO1I7]